MSKMRGFPPSMTVVQSISISPRVWDCVDHAEWRRRAEKWSLQDHLCCHRYLDPWEGLIYVYLSTPSQLQRHARSACMCPDGHDTLKDGQADCGSLFLAMLFSLFYHPILNWSSSHSRSNNLHSFRSKPNRQKVSMIRARLERQGDRPWYMVFHMVVEKNRNPTNSYPQLIWIELLLACISDKSFRSWFDQSSTMGLWQWARFSLCVSSHLFSLTPLNQFLHRSSRSLQPKTRLYFGVGMIAWSGLGLLLSDKAEEVFNL